MPLLHAVVLAVVQGITEFLPVSSDGHLALVPWLFGWDDQGLAFDAALHLGTLGAVVIYFRREITGLVLGLGGNRTVQFGVTAGETGQINARRLFALIVVALVPTAVIALLLKGPVEGSLRKPEWAAAFLLVTALALAVGEFAGRRSRRLEAATTRDAAMMGFAQGFAVLPGLSRSGSTIAAGLFRGLTREAAARLSFLIAVPAIAAAGAISLYDLARAEDAMNESWGVIAVGVVVAFLTGILALGALMRVLRRGSLKPFIAYCLVVGTAVLAARAAGA